VGEREGEREGGREGSRGRGSFSAKQERGKESEEEKVNTRQGIKMETLAR
jgi:hypothetical protein